MPNPGDTPALVARIAIALALLALAAPRVALAQDGEHLEDTATDSATAKCVPACRAGHVCVNGACLSPCNPPCGSGEVCTRSGVCIPPAPPPKPAPAPTPAAGATAAPNPFGGPPPPSHDPVAFARYKRKRNGGVVLMTFGVILVVAAGAGAIASLALDFPELAFVALGVEILGNLLFFPGLAKVIKGNIGMSRAKGARARLGHPPAGLRLAGVSPLLCPSDPGSGGGLALAFTF